MRKAATALLPWAPRHERQAAIGAARTEKERSQATAAQARQVRQQLTRLAHENHFAATIRDSLRRDGQ